MAFNILPYSSFQSKDFFLENNSYLHIFNEEITFEKNFLANEKIINSPTLDINLLQNHKKLFYDWNLNTQKSYKQFQEIYHLCQNNTEFSSESLFYWKQIRNSMELNFSTEFISDHVLLSQFIPTIRDNTIFHLPAALSSGEYIKILEELLPVTYEKIPTLLIHGIHNYSPLQLRCLQDLEYSGFPILIMTFGLEFADFLELPPAFLSFVPKNIEISPPTPCFKTENKTDEQYNQSFQKEEKTDFLAIFSHSLFELWNPEQAEIDLDSHYLKQCFHSFPTEEFQRIRLVKIYYKLEFFLKNKILLTDFINIFEKKFLPQRELSQQANMIPFSLLSLYQEITLSSNEIELFLQSITVLNEISHIFFLEQGDFFHQAFSLLKLFQDNKQNDFLEIQENLLLNTLLTELESKISQCNPSQHKIIQNLLEYMKKLLNEPKKLDFLPPFNFENQEIFSKQPFFSLEKCNKYTVIQNIFIESCQKQKQFTENFSFLFSQNLESPPYQNAEDFVMLGQLPRKVLFLEYDRVHAMSAFLCPFRYFSSHILTENSVFSLEKQYEKFYENLLIMIIWKNFSCHAQQEIDLHLFEILGQIEEKYHCFFPFFSEKQRFDCKLNAETYLRQAIFKGKLEKIREFAPSHMEMKWKFGEAFFQGDSSVTSHHVTIFPSLESSSKRYSLHKLPKHQEQRREQVEILEKNMIDYLNRPENLKNYGSWCHTCPHLAFCK